MFGSSKDNIRAMFGTSRCLVMALLKQEYRSQLYIICSREKGMEMHRLTSPLLCIATEVDINYHIVR